MIRSYTQQYMLNREHIQNHIIQSMHVIFAEIFILNFVFVGISSKETLGNH
jgi:hypothetical protein